MNEQQHPQSAQQIREATPQYQATPIPEPKVFINGKGLVPEPETPTNVDALVQRVLDDPISHVLHHLSHLRMLILALRTDDFCDWPPGASARQAETVAEVYDLSFTLRECLLDCDILMGTMERAAVHLDIIEDAHWVFDQHEDRHALRCARYALITAHDALLTLAQEV